MRTRASATPINSPVAHPVENRTTLRAMTLCKFETPPADSAFSSEVPELFSASRCLVGLESLVSQGSLLQLSAMNLAPQLSILARMSYIITGALNPSASVRPLLLFVYILCSGQSLNFLTPRHSAAEFPASRWFHLPYPSVCRPIELAARSVC